MVSVFVVSLLLIGLSGFLLDMHRRSWQADEQDAMLTERDRRFAKSQYRRRTKASGIIGALGAAVGVGPLVPVEPWPMVLYVGFLGAACLWITLLAALDVWATRQNFARLRSEQFADQIKLSRELKSDER